MGAEAWAVGLSVLALVVGYAIGRRHEREAQREAAERALRTARDESDRTPGQPTNPQRQMSFIRRGRWSR
jgi:hypothetical protein